MQLCLDVGNTHIYSGIFKNNKMLFSFRYPSKGEITSDQLGIFILSFLRENTIKVKSISSVMIASVVPEIDYTLYATFKKYFNISAVFLSHPLGFDIRLNIKTPTELGADRIASAIGAISLYPNRDVIILDFGTATTVCFISEKRVYEGGVILPGIKLGMKALASGASKLSSVEMKKPTKVLGKTTTEQIQSGLLYGHIGSIKEIIIRIKKELDFKDEICVATGGFAQFYKDDELFNSYIPELVLLGLSKVGEIDSIE